MYSHFSREPTPYGAIDLKSFPIPIDFYFIILRKHLRMNQEQYLKDRVDHQQQWYNKKSGTNKSYHLWLRGLIIVLSSFIPLAAGFMEADDYTMRLVLALLGTAIAIVTGVSVMMKFQEKWITYRNTSEALLREKYLFLTTSGPYHLLNEPFALFVSRVEDLLKEEQVVWTKTIGKNLNDKNDD